MNNQKRRDYITLKEATKFCGYSQEYLSLRARKGKLKSVKLGRNWVTKKEWLEEYLSGVQDYNNYIKTIKAKKKKALKKRMIKHPPPGNLPIAKTPKIKLGELRLGFVAALILVLIAAGGILGKDSVLETYDDIDYYAETITDNISAAADNVLANMEYKSVLASASEVFKEYGQWLEGKYFEADKTVIKINDLFISTIPQNIVRAYTKADEFVEQKFTNFIQIILAVGGFDKKSDSVDIGTASLSDKLKIIGANADFGDNAPTTVFMVTDEGILFIGEPEDEEVGIKGITLYDAITEEPYCLTIKNGEITITVGQCGF